jgi:hypothetical protein
VNAPARQRVEIDRERRDQRLAFARLHLGDFAAVKNNTADQLDIVMALAKRPLGRLANRSKGFGQDIVEALPLLQPALEYLRLAAKFVVG